MAISTCWSPSPVTRPAHSPSMVARPSRLRPSSRKKAMVASRSSTTMPMLSIRLMAMYLVSERPLLLAIALRVQVYPIFCRIVFEHRLIQVPLPHGLHRQNVDPAFALGAFHIESEIGPSISARHLDAAGRDAWCDGRTQELRHLGTGLHLADSELVGIGAFHDGNDAPEEAADRQYERDQDNRAPH